MDAGPIWASETFAMREATKSSLYRNEVTEAAITALLCAIERVRRGDYAPEPLTRDEEHGAPAAPRFTGICHRTDAVFGNWRPLMKQADRAIDWRWPTHQVLARLYAGDGSPGVLDELSGEAVYLFDACEEDTLRGEPGTIIARRLNAICRATGDGAVWIGHLKRQDTPGHRQFKLPATVLLGDRVREAPEVPAPLELAPERKTYSDIRYEEREGIGYLHFPFYNGAMSTAQCERLRAAFQFAAQRDTRVIALMGGPDFWSNGLHLNLIEAAESPADESWRNINAMNDLVREIITTDTHLTIAALQGNAGAGGVFLALAADRVVARTGVVLNPHYKAMGNLYGSEYWTYLLPKRVGAATARLITEGRLPMGAAQAAELGLVDDHFGKDVADFRLRIEQLALQLAHDPGFAAMLERKRQTRVTDELAKPLQAYREEELKQMYTNFYGFDPSYHVARYNFVFRVPHSRTPLHLARHRQRTRMVP
jgi:putative two-component system hydrogenase maturation factor HypX/HoxX